MPLHLIKLCVGAPTVEDLAAWQKGRVRPLRPPQGEKSQRGRGSQQMCVTHTTFQTPKRQAELLDGGSLYWVIKGLIQVRQRIVGFDEGQKEDGSPCCLLLLDPEHVPVRPQPRRAFQGWRYLTAEDAPADLGSGAKDGLDDMPLAMRRELMDLGLL